jgi:tetratricopeptide (TPR) repeat protein
VLLSLGLTKGIRFGYSSSPHEDAEKAFVSAQKAVSVDDTFSLSHFVLADALLNRGQHDDAINAAMACLRILPGDAQSHLYLGFFQHWAGRGEEAVKAIKKAQQLDPKYLSSRWVAYLDFEGLACFTAGYYEESAEALSKSIERFGPLVPRQTFLIASYIELGRNEEARTIARQLIKSNPNFSLSTWEYARNYKNFKDSERLLNALRKAGLK